MKEQLLNLIGEQTSPLFRIMSVYNANEPKKRIFENNISAFHIGKGLVLSVAHNLKNEAGLIKSIGENEFQNHIIKKCNPDEIKLLSNSYVLDSSKSKRYLNISNNALIKPIVDALKRINYDTRWVSQYENNICKPYIIIQFENNVFYQSQELTKLFDSNLQFPEPRLDAHTFLVELELMEGFYAEDIAVYRMIDTHQEIIDAIPYAKMSYDILTPNDSLFCLQSSPSGTNLGRLINESKIEGLLDQHAIARDRIGGNFIRKGIRYLLKGYFRFGSSGAPYFSYNHDNQSFEINALQSEASPIQLSIKNDMKGNFQYTNAIASPLSLIKERLEELTN